MNFQSDFSHQQKWLVMSPSVSNGSVARPEWERHLVIQFGISLRCESHLQISDVTARRSSITPPSRSSLKSLESIACRRRDPYTHFIPRVCRCASCVQWAAWQLISDREINAQRFDRKLSSKHTTPTVDSFWSLFLQAVLFCLFAHEIFTLLENWMKIFLLMK